MLEKIILVGANGKLGPAIINALLSAKTFTVTILSRASSKSKYPADIKITRTSDDPDVEELVPLLQGQDAVIVIFGGTIGDLQIRLADAAVQAGVKRFIPADFGSCDSSSEKALSLMPLYRTKQKVRKHLQKLESKLGWTSLVCGHFFDYGLRSGLLQIDLNSRRAIIFDGGDIKWSTTTIDTIATAVVRILQIEETKNRMLYVQSFCITQNELSQALGGEWQAKHIDSEEYIKEQKVEADKGNAEPIENLVSVVEIVDANWEGKNDFANTLLGLEEEHLDEVVGRVVI